jgi:hypothetical protein
MQKLENEGKFIVKITNCMYKALEKPEDPKAFTLLLRCETEDGFYIDHTLYFTSKVIASGKMAGLTVTESSIQTLEKIGVEGGMPGNIMNTINAEDGLYASIDVQWEEYINKQGEEKTVLKSKWLNAISNLVSLNDMNINDAFDGLYTDIMTKKQKSKSKAFGTQPAPKTSGAAKSTDIPF